MSNVLIIEDNSDIADLYVRIFFEHQTVVLDDVPEALRFLESHKPDLVITDFHLPSGTGNDVIHHMRTHHNLSNVPILGISVDDMWRNDALKQGASAFIAKPIDIQQLLLTSRTLLTQTSAPIAPHEDPADILDKYKAAYHAVYKRVPDCYWTGRHYLIEKQRCDETWLRSETERLRNVASQPTTPRHALLRLIDKIRKI